MSKRQYDALKDCKKEVGLDADEFVALKTAHDADESDLLIEGLNEGIKDWLVKLVNRHPGVRLPNREIQCAVSV